MCFAQNLRHSIWNISCDFFSWLSYFMSITKKKKRGMSHIYVKFDFCTFFSQQIYQRTIGQSLFFWSPDLYAWVYPLRSVKIFLIFCPPRTLHVELCTQAWVKFYEVLSSFKIVPDTDFCSLHLCEAPGAFIAALNHYLQQHGKLLMYSWSYWNRTIQELDSISSCFDYTAPMYGRIFWCSAVKVYLY